MAQSRLWAFTLGLLLLAAAAVGDTILLKNGQRLDGKIIRQTKDTLILQISNVGTTEIRRKDVARIIRQETPLERYQQAAARLRPTDVEGHYQLGRYCLEHGLDDEAVREFRKVLAAKPAAPRALGALRRLFDPKCKAWLAEAQDRFDVGQYAGARGKLNLILRQYPESSHARAAQQLLAQSLARQGDHPAALQQWQRLLAEDPSFEPAYRGAMRLCRELGNWPEAAVLLGTRLRHERDPAKRQELLTFQRRLVEIVRLADRVAEAPDQAEARIALGDAFVEAGMKEQAVTQYEVAIAAGATGLRVTQFVGRYRLEEFDLPRAQAAWTRLHAMAREPAAKREAEQNLLKLENFRLVADYLEAPNSKARDAIFERIQGARLSRSTVEALLRRGRRFSRRDTGIIEGQVEIPTTGQGAAYALYVPDRYTPDRAWPLVLALHQREMSGRHYLLLWREQAEKHGYLVLAPDAPRRSGWGDPGQELALAALRRVRNAYHVDADRVFIGGSSMGGGGAYELALRSPSLFAGCILRAAAVPELSQIYIPNARRVPFLILHGTRDSVVPVGSIRELVKLLSKHQVDTSYTEVLHGFHEDFVESNADIFRWMNAHRRNPYPRRVDLYTCSLRAAQAYWVRIDELAEDVFDPRRPINVPKVIRQQPNPEILRRYYLSRARRTLASVVARIEKNNLISVRSSRVRQFTLFLSDRLVDLQKPVTVRVNGQVAFREIVPRSARRLLEEARRARETSMLFSAALTLRPGE